MINFGLSLTSLAVRKRNADILAFNPLTFFDLTDVSKLSQDLAGTVPVTDGWQEVGSVKDKSANGFHMPAVSDQARGRYLNGYPNAISVGTSSAPSAPFEGITESHLLEDGAQDADLRGGWFHDADYFGLRADNFHLPPETTGTSRHPAGMVSRGKPPLPSIGTSRSALTEATACSNDTASQSMASDTVPSTNQTLGRGGAGGLLNCPRGPIVLSSKGMVTCVGLVSRPCPEPR